MQTKNWHILARTRPNLNCGIGLQKSYVTELDMRGLACNFCLFFKICCNINTYVANHQEKNKNLDLCEGNMNLKNPYTREIVPPKEHQIQN